MKITYDRETDTLVIVLREGRIRESDEVLPDVIADYDDAGRVARFEILRASHSVDKADEMQFMIAAKSGQIAPTQS